MPSGEFSDEEAFNPRTLRDEIPQETRAHLRTLQVILRNLPANRHASLDAQIRENCIRNSPADIVKIDINCVLIREKFCQLRSVVAHVFVVESGIEAEFVEDIRHLLICPRRADNAAAFNLRNLADDRTDCACRARNEHRLAILQFADFQQTEVGSQPRHTENADTRGDRRETRVDLP